MPAKKTRPASGKPRPAADFKAAFEQLKALLHPYAKRLTVTMDTADKYHLYGPYHPKFKKPIYFGGVEIRKNYVSYHLIPIYAFPKLLDDASVDLMRRNQGKSCFNFTTVEPAMLKELAALTKRGFQKFAPEFIPES